MLMSPAVLLYTEDNIFSDLPPSSALQKISSYIFIATPESVELSGDFQDLLGSGALDVSGMNIRL